MVHIIVAVEDGIKEGNMELREKIAERIYHVSHQWRAGVFLWESCSNKGRYYDEADQILTLIKQDGWVRLAKGQSLASGVKFGGNLISDAYNDGYWDAQQDMVKVREENGRQVAFRKVEL